MKGTTYRDLVAWQKAIDLCVLVFRVSAAFPQHELYGLTSQIRRGAVSIPSNLAEGAGRITNGEFVQAVGYARGSLLEVETQLIIANRLGYLGATEMDTLFRGTTEVGKLTNGLLRSLKQPHQNKSASHQ
jgi:four helix bundle protein